MNLLFWSFVCLLIFFYQKMTPVKLLKLYSFINGHIMYIYVFPRIGSIFFLDGYLWTNKKKFWISFQFLRNFSVFYSKYITIFTDELGNLSKHVSLCLFLWHLVSTKWHIAIANSVGLSLCPGFANLGTFR